MLFFANGGLFAAGAAAYTFRPATAQETSPRVILQIAVDRFETTAFVDTGGMYLLLSPEIAQHVGLNHDRGSQSERLVFRGVHLSGFLYRVPLTLLAEQGNSLEIDATAFVPQLMPGQEWPNELPCVLGMMGCLERLRFAVDPTDDTFYFGEIG